jgi:hypothetical protein
VKARGGTPEPSVRNDPRPKWAHEPGAMILEKAGGTTD